MRATNFISTDYLAVMYGKFEHFCMERLNHKMPVITLTELVFMFDLANNKNSYDFKLRSNDSSDNPNERKLTGDHFFLPTHAALQLQKYNTAADGAQDGNFPIFTHADPNYFDGVSNGLNEADALRLLHAPGAHLTISQGGSDLFHEFATDIMGYTPDSQYLTAAASGQAVAELPQYGPTLEQRGFGRLYGCSILKGSTDTTLKIDLAAGNNNMIAGGFDASGDPVATRNRGILRVKGFRFTHPLDANSGKFCRV